MFQLKNAQKFRVENALKNNGMKQAVFSACFMPPLKVKNVSVNLHPPGLLLADPGQGRLQVEGALVNSPSGNDAFQVAFSP